ncbi:chaperonin 10-like protein [Talaromyces proteolyticus]|uniref:Chaperonin 10-like protein n=1 Tax=Talaromyces proteolyticus TaxID=1131652 RepID=A0AAD4Q307_9EURO|nr:chaperonin 10-like protein [Talaromyces proteolyticus]KAH8700926.1 chaperonin 10-like protein [Talaromyces proteolyticus]
MTSVIPPTMRSLCVHAYVKPTEFGIADIPVPKITTPNQVLIRVHAACINPVDMEIAGGNFKAIMTPPFPLKLGFDLSGTVVEIGSSVDNVAVGDEVFCSLLATDTGAWSEYALATASLLTHKPKSLSHVEAASLPMVAMTAVQALDKVPNGLAGKTILIAAGLGGVGSIACQIAKSVYGAKKVITTVSTDNVSKVNDLFGKGAVDEVIDYKKSDVLKEIPHGSVDVLLDTVGVSKEYYPLLLKNSGSITSIYGTIDSKSVKAAIPNLHIPLLVQLALDFRAGWKWLHAWWYGIYWQGTLQNANSPDLQRVAGWVDEGKLKPIVGRTVKFEDIKAVREACVQMSSASRSIGKTVIEII